MRTALACAGSAAALVLAACGGAGSTDVRTGGGATVSRSASEVLITAADMPGYDVMTEAEADPSALAAASTFESCAGAAAALGDEERSALSPAFYKGTTVMVSSLAVVAESEDEARRAVSDLSHADLAGCLTDLFRSVLGLDVAPGTTATTELVRSAAGVGDQSATWRTTIQVTAGASTVAAYADLTFFRSGRTVAALFDIHALAPLPDEERSRLLDAMERRASAAH